MKKFIVLALLLLALTISISAQRKPVDLIIIGGTIVTMDQDKRVIRNGSVAIEKDTIVAVGPSTEISQKYTSRKKVFARNKVVIPGLINTHTHIPMTVFRGIADDLDLNEWLTKYIFPAEAKNVDENMVRIGTRLGLAELIRGGTTTYCDMYYFEGAIAYETAKAGVRGVLGQTLIDFPAPDYKTFREALNGTDKFVKKWKNHPLIVPAVAPHAPYTVSEANLKSARALANQHSAPLVIHLAEAETELDFVKKNKNMRPIEYVSKIGLLKGKTIAAHVIYANDREMDLLKRAGVGVAHNPESNMKLAAGVAPIPQMITKKLRLGLGTDGAASNNDLSLWEEMDSAAKLHKVFWKDPKVASAKEVFEMATIGGARTLHMEDKIGSIEKGKLADIVVVDFDSLSQTPSYNVYSHLVYATKSSDVRTVVINGTVVMRNRQLLTLDESSIKKEANALRDKIVKSLMN